MTTDDFLARLTAGLDEDERAARAALEGPARLESDWEVVTYRVDLDDRPVQTVADSNGVFLAPDLGRSSAHIARQDPKTTLDRVEAIRRLIEECSADDAFEDHVMQTFDPGAFREGVAVATEYVINALASIYPGPTEES